MRRTLAVALVALAVFSSGVVGGTTATASTTSVRTPHYSFGVEGNLTWRWRNEAVWSDTVNASLSLESYYSSYGHYPTSKMQAVSPNNPDKVVVSMYDQLRISTDGFTNYCIAGWTRFSMYNAAQPMMYDSSNGGLQPPRPQDRPRPGAPCAQHFKYSYVLP